jgi:hypothetical protein
LNHWVWVESERLRDCNCWYQSLHMHIGILNLLISHLDSKFVLTLDFHIYLDWDYSPHRHLLVNLLMPLFNFFALEVKTILSGGCFSFRLKFQCFYMLMTTSAHKATCTQFGKYRPHVHWLWWLCSLCSTCIAQSPTSSSLCVLSSKPFFETIVFWAFFWSE